MGHYKSNLRDLEFNLFEVFGRQQVLGSPPYQDFDPETARDILHEVARLAEHELADSLLDSDRCPPAYDPATRSVTLPESFKRSFRAYLDGDWGRLDTPGELGGFVIPPSLRWAVGEMVLGSNPAVHIYSSGFAFAKVLYQLGTPAQQRLAELMVQRQWGSTMVLTEPDAGSDVGAGRTRAVQQPDGTWHITGVKRFITSGEADIFDNIVHFVLARPVGAGPGTKGLSLFLVPKFAVDLETGELGERNGVYATNVEHKMGLKVSTTCELTFGDRAPAVGTLMGGVHDGIAQMFKIIEFARMMVGTKAIATLSSGYLNALEYAKTRVQGADLTQLADKTAPRVTITHHPDVRRSLMLQKAYAEGLRALVIYTASQQDTVDRAQLLASDDGAGSNAPAVVDPDVDPDVDMARRVNDLLLPLVKGVGSERAWVLLGTESLQTFGGSGFLQDYPVEQYVRDAKIDTLYEGTTAIQGMDFFFRKIVRDRGEALRHLSTQIQEFAKDVGGTGTLLVERELLGKAADDVSGILGFMVGALAQADPAKGGDPVNVYKVGQNTTRLLLACGDLVVGWLLLRQAEVALAALGRSSADRAFYQGKVAAASYFAKTVLPKIAAERQIAETTDNALMDLPEDAF
ncbi:MAG TPA: acyl-CoA dehydrogenase [Dermatophilaceae bacterium]|nr:acyl-CoA dehydrogenase [Dermatophilaceae bacterium]